jgi:hypothetical protein
MPPPSLVLSSLNILYPIPPHLLHHTHPLCQQVLPQTIIECSTHVFPAPAATSATASLPPPTPTTSHFHLQSILSAHAQHRAHESTLPAPTHFLLALASTTSPHACPMPSPHPRCFEVQNPLLLLILQVPACISLHILLHTYPTLPSCQLGV